MNKHFGTAIISGLLLISSVAAANESEQTQQNSAALTEVDIIMLQINRLSPEQQTDLIKQLINLKADTAITEAKASVDELKQTIKEEVNDPKYQVPLNKAKQKLKKLYHFFKDEEETEAAPETTL